MSEPVESINILHYDELDVDGEDVENENVVEESQSVQSVAKKSKANTSDCWKFFTKIGSGNDGIGRAKCNA